MFECRSCTPGVRLDHVSRTERQTIIGDATLVISATITSPLVSFDRMTMHACSRLDGASQPALRWFAASALASAVRPGDVRVRGDRRVDERNDRGAGTGARGRTP